MKRECVICGIGFEARTCGKYCSDRCRAVALKPKGRVYSLAYNNKHREERAEKARHKRAEKRRPKPCVVCGDKFLSLNGNQKTCSRKCAEANNKKRNANYQRTHRAERAEWQRNWRRCNPERWAAISERHSQIRLARERAAARRRREIQAMKEILNGAH